MEAINTRLIFIMSKNYKKNKENQKIAKQRIKKLFILAEKQAYNGKYNLSDRYVKLARKLSMKYLVQIPKEYKRFFCKHCYSYLYPDITCRMRISKRKIILFCKKCKKFTRISFK